MRELLDASETRVRSRLVDLEGDLESLLGVEGLDESIDEPERWSPEYQKRWSDVTRINFRDLATLHHSFFRHLTTGQVPPADIGFFLARGAGLSPTRPSHRRRFALSSSQYTSWESETLTAETTIPAIPVPYLETLTPLRWPLLLHELGHHVLPADEETRLAGGDIAQQMVASRLGAEATVGSTQDLEEVLADMVAERHCGPAFALALAREAQLVSLFKRPAGSTAPLLADRLAQLEFWDVLEPAFPDPWTATLGPATKHLDDARSTATELLVLPAAVVRDEVVRRIVELFEAKEPAPAVQLSPPPPTTWLIEALNPERLPTIPDSVEGMFATAGETACTDAEVLSAAWHLQACQDPQVYLTQLRERLTNEAGELNNDLVDLRRSEVARLDTAVSRSLQTAAVHRWLIEHDTTIRANVTPAAPPLGSPNPTSEPGHLDSKGAMGVGEPEIGGESGLAATREKPAAFNETAPLTDIYLLRRLTLPPDNPDRLVLRPMIDPSQIGGTTVDLRLGTEWETLKTSRFQALNPTDALEEMTTLLDASVEQFRLTSGQNEGLVLHPGELILALTLEYLKLPDNLWGNLEGRSTWARIGLQVHASAGMVDAGFDGYLTLELQNTSRLPLVLYPGLRVAQMAFFPVPGVSRVYRRKSGAAYSDQTTARTAFPRQHEHQALRTYHEQEREAERRFSARADGAPKT